MGLGSRNEPCSISVFFYSILLVSGSSFSYPLAGEEAGGKCRCVRLDECDRVRLGSSHPLWMRLPRVDASRRETSLASCVIAETTTQPTSKGRATPNFQAEQTGENFTACAGSVELEHRQRPYQFQLWHGSMNEGTVYVLFPWESYQDLLSLFSHQPGVSTVQFDFTCQAAPSLCLKLSLHGHTTHLYHASPGYKAANVRLVRRDAREAVDLSSPLSSGPKSSIYSYVLPVLLVTVAILALMISAAVCVKGERNEERVPAFSGGKKESSSHSNQHEMSVLSNGLSSEAVMAPPVVENGPKTCDSPSGTNAEEVRISMGFPDSPASPDEAEHETKRMSHRSTSSPLGSDEGRSRRSQEPLPQPPVLEVEDVAAPVQPEEGDRRKEDQDEQEEDDEGPYDYARVPGQEREEGSSESDAGSNDDGDEEAKKVPGKYGKVTRHSGINLPTQETSYAEVKDLHVMDRRERSVTEPVDPCSARDQMPLPRTFTESASASHLPLPAIPNIRSNLQPNVTEDDEDDMYDSVRDEVKEAAIGAREKKQKLYEAVDPGDEDDSVMYESVPEELKEGVQQFQAPAVQLPPPKSTRMMVLPSNLPSPTKRLGSDSTAPPDSPGIVKKPGKKLTRDASKKEKGKGRGDDEEEGGKAKKQAKESGKKEKRRSKAEDEEDTSKSKNFSLFGRKKARSISAGIGKGKKDYKQVESPQPSSPMSPEHHPPSIRPPALPLPFPGVQPEDDDDDDDDMYDSVTVPRTVSADLSPTRQKAVDVAKAKSASLPLNARSTGLAYNTRANEPLPEVPEDSGSAVGGGAFIIKHKRVYEPGDPKYDIVGSTPKGVPLSKSNPELVEDDEVDPEYDTVNAPQSTQKAKQQQEDQRQIGRQYAEVFKPPIAKASSISHDDLGYAMVDPDIIMRKRAASMHESHSVSVVAADSQQDREERPAEPCPPQQNADKIPVIILGSNDPGYNSIKSMSAQPNGLPSQGPDKVPLLILSSGDSGHNAIKGASAEAGVTGCEDSKKLTPVPEEPGYESVNKLVGDGVPYPGYVNVMLEDQPSVEVANNMYSQVDLVKKHEDRQRKLETSETGSLDVTSSSERLRTPSPAPPIPPAGDLGDLSEFEPPPIPRQNLSVSPLHVEHPYSKVIQKGDRVEVEEDALGYAAVNIVNPEQGASKRVEKSYDFAPGYEAITDVVPVEKRQDSSHMTPSEPLLPLDRDGLALQTAKSLQPSTQHQSSISNSFASDQTPADMSGPRFQPAPLENSDRTGDHLYEEVDRDDGDR